MLALDDSQTPINDTLCEAQRESELIELMRFFWGGIISILLSKKGGEYNPI